MSPRFTLASFGATPPSACCTRSISSRATRPSCRSRSRSGPACSGATSKWSVALNCPAESCFSSDLVTRPLASSTAVSTAWYALSTSSTSTPAWTRSLSVTPTAARISFSVSVTVSVLRAARLPR